MCAGIETSQTHALERFALNMASCVRRFAETDPEASCWTYDGPGVAGFWFRRAAIETTLHRMDVADALAMDDLHLTETQGNDAILETLEFALPFAARLSSVPDGELLVQAPCLAAPIAVGTGSRRAVIEGETHEVLNALWGRHHDRVAVDGDRDVATAWLSVIEIAFSGR